MLELIAQHFAWAQNPVVLARQTLAGISNGMLLFLISAGLSLIFGVLRVLNFAHGALFMLGALIAVSTAALLADPLAGFAAALIGAAAGLALLGAAIETNLLRRIYRAPHEMQLLLTFGLVFILGDAAKIIWGREEHSIGMPAILTGGAHAFGLVFPLYRLFLIAVALLITVGLMLGIEATRFGAQVRAAVNNQRMARVLGIDVDTLFAVTFALGSGLAGLRAALAVDPGVKLHLYGKLEPRPGRKMGHLTAIANDTETALKDVQAARNVLSP